MALIPVYDPPPTEPAAVPASLGADASTFAWTIPGVPTPDPGDPDGTLVPATPRRLGRDVRLLLKRPGVSSPPLAEIRSLSAPEWTDRLSVQGGSFRAVVAAADPGWDAVGEPGAAVVRGREGAALDPQRTDAEVVVDGERVFCGCFAGSPRRVEGDWQEIDLVDGLGVAAQMDVRTPWGDDNIDILGGRGSFDGVDPLAGWTITGDLGYSVGVPSTFGPYLNRCLRIHTGSAKGKVYSPWVWTSASEGTAGWEGSAQVHLTEQFGDQSVTVSVEVSEFFGDPVGFAPTTGRVSGPGGAWGHGWEPVSAMRYVWSYAAPTDALIARVVFDIDARGSAIGIDEVRLRRSGLTSLWTDDGSGRDADYVNQVALALRSSVLRDPAAGWVIATSPSGYSTPGVLWWDDAGTRASEAIGQVVNRPNGPDVWCDANWAFQIWGDRGRVRNDIILDDFTCPDASWERTVPLDALTQWTYDGLGHRWSRATPSDKRRVEQINYERGEDADGRTLELWRQIREDRALLPPYSGTSLVPMRHGRVEAGDSVRVAHRRGRETVAGGFRVGEVVHRFDQEIQEVSWGSDTVTGTYEWWLGEES